MANYSVTNLHIERQAGTESTYDARWDFTAPPAASSFDAADLKVGSRVTINAGASFTNGVAVRTTDIYPVVWKITQVEDTKVRIGKNDAGTRSLDSWININNISLAGLSGAQASVNTFDHYAVMWQYLTGNNVWHKESWSDLSTDVGRVSSFNAPENAIQIKIFVKPVAKKHKNSAGKQVEYWTGESKSASLLISSTYPSQISMPSIALSTEGTNVILTNTGITDSRTDAVQYEIYNYNNLKRITTQFIDVRLGSTYYEWTGGNARRVIVRARAVNIVGESRVADPNGWTEYSEVIQTRPSAPVDVSAVIRSTEDNDYNIYIEWKAPKDINNIDESLNIVDYTYEIQYTTDEANFIYNRTEAISTLSVGTVNSYLVAVGEADKYFFRIRASINGVYGPYSKIVSATVGKKPDPPTVWANYNSVLVGESVTLFWAHNPKDGSRQKKVHIAYRFCDTSYDPEDVTPTQNIWIDDTNHDEPTIKYTFSTTGKANKYLRMRVYTAGELEEPTVTGSYKSVYSETSEVVITKVYSMPTITVGIDSISSALPVPGVDAAIFPIRVIANAGNESGSTTWNQKPIAYNIRMVTLNKYTATNDRGDDMVIPANTVIYNKNINNTAYSIIHEITPENLGISLKSGDRYRIYCSVNMNSGLTAEAYTDFTYASIDVDYNISCDMSYSKNFFTARLFPSAYIADQNGNVSYPNYLKLKVFRRNYDGSLTSLSTKLLDNPYGAGVVDKHPQIDIARYRIVVTNINTGAITYLDWDYEYSESKRNIFGIIDWEEGADTFDYLYPDEDVSDRLKRSMVEVRWNLDITENASAETKTVKYAGRENPVSYYGTHISQSSSWSFDIERTDADSLARFRHLSRWRGPAYVREPNGLGYWANIKVTISQTHDSLVTKIKLDITKVEGGA